jgi:predicted  nucleic acid-binding Zn-ribbon protein
MKNNKFYILVFVVIGLLLYNLYTMKQVKTDINSYNEKIDIIGKEIDSVQGLNKELDNKILSLHSEIKLIDGDITRVQNNITTIRENTDEKINSVDAFTFSELQKFFANRYDSIVERTGSKTGN